MTIDMFSASVPVFIRYLNNLSGLLDKGQAHADAKGFDSAVLVGSRLAPDMLPLSSQVQFACDGAKRCTARLAGQEPPSDPDTETTMAELKARIAKTLKYLEGFSAADIAGTEDKDIDFKTPKGSIKFTGIEFLTGFALPNFFFHVTTAHAILRHNGVDIGKFDYVGMSRP